MDIELLTKEIKRNLKYYTEQVTIRTQKADDVIAMNDIIKYFEGKRDSYKELLIMIENNAPRV